MLKHLSYKTLLIILLIMLSGCAATHPSDETIRSFYLDHKESLEILVAMLVVDKQISHISPTEHPGAISQERWLEYERVFKGIGVKDMIAVNRPDGTILLILSSNGLAVGGSTKGLILIQSPKSERLYSIVSRLDSGFKPRKEGEYIKRIADRWYIYYGI